MKIEIGVEVDQVINALKKFDSDTIKMTKKILRTVGTKYKQIILKEIRTSLKKQTGSLLRGYFAYVPKAPNKNYVAIYPRKAKKAGKNEKQEKSPLAQAVVNNYGKIIKPTIKENLWFGGIGKWVKTKLIKIPAKNFYQRARSKYINNDQYLKDISAIVDKEIKKIWG